MKALHEADYFEEPDNYYHVKVSTFNPPMAKAVAKHEQKGEI